MTILKAGCPVARLSRYQEYKGNTRPASRLHARRARRRKPEIRIYRGLGYAARQILAAIPANRWVTAAEIAAETRISSQTVNDLINHQLLHEYVERRLERPHGVSRYLYRRL